MRYLILIQSNPQSREVWEGLSDEQRMAFGRAHLALTDELMGTGELVASEGLPDPSTATLVSVRGGRTLTSDGPFAEAKEYLAGYYVIEASDLDAALAWAAKVPNAFYGTVEVRPVLNVGAASTA